MTKEQLKYYIDNIDAIFEKIEEIPEEISVEMITENIEEAYNVFAKYGSNIIKEYNLNLDSFKIIVSVAVQDKTLREQILGRDEANQLLKNIIDIYGDKSYEILDFGNDMSEINGILSGEKKEEYVEFYMNSLNKKCKEAYDLTDLSDIILSTKPEYVTPNLIEQFLNNSDKKINGDTVVEFLEKVPAASIDGEILKKLVDRLKTISNEEIHRLEKLSPELFDEELFKNILNKAESSVALMPIFESISKSKELWELVISKSNEYIYSLPEQKVDEKMTDDEYQKWYEDIIIEKLGKSEDIRDIFARLKDFQKTPRICEEAARLLKEENGIKINRFLETIPEESRTRSVYETLLSKSADIIKEIPYETFEKDLSQEEYQKWVDNLIIQKILSSNNFEEIFDVIPRGRRNETIWNVLLDKCIQTSGNNFSLALSKVPTNLITRSMCERAIRDISDDQVFLIPIIDKNLDGQAESVRMEYAKWISQFTEEEKQEYRNWYESKILEYIEKNPNVNIFKNRIPHEAITMNIINKCLELQGVFAIENIPVPSEHTQYNEQYEDILISAIKMIKDKDYAETESNMWETIDEYEQRDILREVPTEYITDKVILEAVKKRPIYLKYADYTREDFKELLNIAYKGKLESLGRKELSKQEVDLITKFAKNNANLFSTLQLEILSPEIVECIGEKSLEKIVRYSEIQSSILEIATNKDTLTTFGYVLENLGDESIFIEPIIEQLSMSINREQIYKYDSSKHEDTREPNEFLKLAASIIRDNERELTEEQKTVITYLTLNPVEANRIKNADDILNYVENKNSEIDAIIANEQTTLIGAKDAYFKRIVGLNYESVIELIEKYGNDNEELLVKYGNRELTTYKEKSEKEALEIISKLKSLIQEHDIDKIRELYKDAIANEDITQSYKRYKYATLLDNTLRRAYGRDIVQSLNETGRENNTETVERTENGEEYIVRKLNGPFNRMVSVMDAYAKSEAEGDMYDRWNTNKMAENHALCYSFLNESNPGTALLGDTKSIIISIKKINEEALTALAPYDLCSFSKTNTTITARAQKFYMGQNLPNQTRRKYSEADIEIQDVLDGTEEYKKIQIESIICFEEVDEASIQASIELSKKLGYKVPIELIDRRELAFQAKQDIEALLEQFKTGETLQPDLVEQIITKFNNVRSAHMDSSLSAELLGEEIGKENPAAIFNKIHLNRMLEECIEVSKKKIEEGSIQEGLQAITEIRKFIQEEREKHFLMDTMWEKQQASGIEFSIDYRIDEILREYIEKKVQSEYQCQSSEILQGVQNLDSQTFGILYGMSNLPEQLSIQELTQEVDFNEIQKSINDIYSEGYYSGNEKYDEEHVARVVMFSNIIANLEDLDNDTKKLLAEAAKYYSCGRQLDIEEPHQEYSAKIAAERLNSSYSQKDISIIQAAIELQNFRLNDISTDEGEQAKREETAIMLCNKYGLTETEMQKVDIIAKYIGDAVELDKARVIQKAPDHTKFIGRDLVETFSVWRLQTDSAKKMIKASYDLQDELAARKLEKMLKIVESKFDPRQMIEEMFTEKDSSGEIIRVIASEEFAESPIAKVEYLKHKFPEINFEELINEMESKRELPTELPIATNCIDNARKISEARIGRSVQETSHQVKQIYSQIENPELHIDSQKGD